MTGRFGAWGEKELLNTRADFGVGLLRREWFPLAGGVHAQGERSKDFPTRRVEAGQRGGFYQRFPEITLGATVTWHQITFFTQKKDLCTSSIIFQTFWFRSGKGLCFNEMKFQARLNPGAGGRTLAGRSYRRLAFLFAFRVTFLGGTEFCFSPHCCDMKFNS